MSIWNEAPLKYTPAGIAMNLMNGKGLFPNGSTEQNNRRNDDDDYLFCPACKAYSAVDCGDNKQIYCTSCQTYSNL